jgi:XapX domain-containing protein
MKALLISFAVGLVVGVLYGVIRVKSPAPPIVALLGLLGMVIGEQMGGWVLAKKVSLTQAASVCIVGKHWGGRTDSQPAAQKTFSAN